MVSLAKGVFPGSETGTESSGAAKRLSDQSIRLRFPNILSFPNHLENIFQN